MKDAIRKRLMQAALAITMGAAGGVATHYAAQRPSDAVLLAMELGSYYESSGRHIGTPYIDKLGKGQPLTVCNGVTGPEVVAGRTYSRDDCKRLELPKYMEAERLARAAFKHWDTYNVWVRVSLIDMVYNLGPSVLDGTTLVRLGNAGDLVGMCQQMPRWVRGTVNGQPVVLPGLVDRRDTSRELCEEWGRDGHFSAGLIARAQP
ncbi:MAG: hypothetical protein RJB68_2512 [Pseudomonadota bacterium]|jgi:lysozyme